MRGAIAGKANDTSARSAGWAHFNDDYRGGDGVDCPLREYAKVAARSNRKGHDYSSNTNAGCVVITARVSPFPSIR
jgi:hypothetical protein